MAVFRKELFAFLHIPSLVPGIGLHTCRNVPLLSLPRYILRSNLPVRSIQA